MLFGRRVLDSSNSSHSRDAGFSGRTSGEYSSSGSGGGVIVDRSDSLYDVSSYSGSVIGDEEEHGLVAVGRGGGGGNRILYVVVQVTSAYSASVFEEGTSVYGSA